MWRHSIRPRPGWKDKVVEQGLVFPMTDLPDGSQTPYWNESAWYEVTMDEVLHLERVTEELYEMCKHAASVMASGDRFSDAQLGLASGTLPMVRESLKRDDPSVYARFDLVWNGVEPKMLEINGDTPTGLVESAVIQWNWLEDVFPDADQWNSVHDRLVKWWSDQRAAGAFPGNEAHFFNSAGETTGEEAMTVAYMRDTAAMAGLATYGHEIEDLGWESEQRAFVDYGGRKIRTAFKLYPWEDMLDDEFGKYIVSGLEREPVRWIEPIWKTMLSTKAILPVLWELYPDHPNLLPAYFGTPGDLLEWVAKPLHGREGSNIRIHTITSTEDDVHEGPYDTDTMVYQEWSPLPSYEGNRAVIGSWIVDGVAAGMMVRESDGPVTDYYARFVPHAIGTEARPDQETIQKWLAE
ncbi:glutathionylspermidine synthase family protein [Kribbella sp. NPDC051620]|uniref:glutathionylspermidine synthase family protein n=1 Tax=Kribbella sp. NPDC051620 TaxID=3364120 RepID=UPI0037BAFFA5